MVRSLGFIQAVHDRIKVVIVLLGLVTIVRFSMFLFKLWQKKREEEYARLLKLFEDDDELEVELGIRNTSSKVRNTIVANSSEVNYFDKIPSFFSPLPPPPPSSMSPVFNSTSV